MEVASKFYSWPKGVRRREIGGSQERRMVVGNVGWITDVGDLMAKLVAVRWG